MWSLYRLRQFLNEGRRQFDESITAIRERQDPVVATETDGPFLDGLPDGRSEGTVGLERRFRCAVSSAAWHNVDV